MGLVSLIVLEPGSEWPGHIGDPENVVAVGGEEGLLLRLGQGLDLLQRRGQRVRVAVLACNDATDASSACRRAAVARTLLTAVGAVAFGRLVLSSAGRASTALRGELLSLAGTLTHGLPGTSATVSVRFGAPADRAQPLRRPR